MKTINEARWLHKASSLLSLVLLTFVWALSVSAQVKPDWKPRWDKALSEAKKEGKVVVWGPPGELIRKAMTEGFRKAFPDITIEYSGARGGEQASRVKAERDGGVYSVDVFLAGTSTALRLLKPIGALDPIGPALILPEVTDAKYWRDQRLHLSDVEGRYNLIFVSYVGTRVLYNLEQVRPEEVDELYELLDPKWKGKLVINDPLPPGNGDVTFRWIWRILGPEKAADYYRKLRSQAGAVDRDQRRQIEWVAQGKYAILLAPSDGVLQQMLGRGIKVGVIGEFKDFGGYLSASFGSVSLINRAPHPNAAKVFINWLLGRDAQIAWSRAMNHVSLRVDVPTDHLPSYALPRPGVKYWSSDSEENVGRSAEETKFLKELFGR
jgi:ABC-type Fe3+ transport system substrate-binding protein